MEVGQKVYCKSDVLSLDNVQATVTRTKVLGCEDSITVMLDDGRQFAFFGERLNCISKSPILAKTEDSEAQEVKEVPELQVKKKVTKKKVKSTV
jgi:hypothetical protein